MLSSFTPPFNHFELADYRDRALAELGIADIDDSRAVTLYAAEILRPVTAGDLDFAFALRAVKDLCVAANDDKNLYDFYLLFHAHSDLLESELQWYWQGADRGNIESIIRQRIAEFLSSVEVHNPAVNRTA